MLYQQEERGLDNVNWNHRGHTRKGTQTGFQTGGIISDTADAIGDGADWAMGVPGDTLKGVGNLTGNAWDWGVGGSADAASDAWDWGVGGTADATEGAWDWAVGGTADATESAWDWAAGGTADAAGMGGGGSEQQNPNGGGNGNGDPNSPGLLNPNTMMIGGAALLGLGGAYYMSQR